jgi:hypothetical protein
LGVCDGISTKSAKTHMQAFQIESFMIRGRKGEEGGAGRVKYE